MTSFWRPGGSVTFFWANPFIRLRTTSIPEIQKVYMVFDSLSPGGNDLTSLITGIQLKYGFFVSIAQKLPSKT